MAWYVWVAAAAIALFIGVAIFSPATVQKLADG